MMMAKSFQSFICLALFLFIGSSLAQDADDHCQDPVFRNGYNASGSVTVPGFRVNDSYPETEWTWTRFVSDVYNNTTNQSALWQTFGLQTAPQQNLSDPSLPYTGCIIVPDEVMVAGRKDDGTCHGVFSSGCISEILSKVNASAAAYSGTQTGSSSSFSCEALLESIIASSSSKCDDQFAGTMSAEFLPNDFSSPTSARCLPDNLGNSNASADAFFGWGKEATDLDNFTHYDQAIRTPHPVIVAVWLKATSGSTSEAEEAAKMREVGWADTRLFCVPANETTPGSRNLTVANRAAGAAGTIQIFTKGTITAVALPVLLGLVL